MNSLIDTPNLIGFITMRPLPEIEPVFFLKDLSIMLFFPNVHFGKKKGRGVSGRSKYLRISLLVIAHERKFYYPAKKWSNQSQTSRTDGCATVRYGNSSLITIAK